MRHNHIIHGVETVTITPCGPLVSKGHYDPRNIHTTDILIGVDKITLFHEGPLNITMNGTAQ